MRFGVMAVANLPYLVGVKAGLHIGLPGSVIGGAF
jgi:hypothetical protein